MTAKIIAVTDFSGGYGQTAVCYCLAIAAISQGKKVATLSLCPWEELETTLKKSTVYNKGTGNTLRLSPNKAKILEFKEIDIKEIIAPVRDALDLIIIDTWACLPMLIRPLLIADHIVIPTTLHSLSLQSLTLGLRYADFHQVLHRVSGAVIVNALKPLSRSARVTKQVLDITGIGMKTVLWHSNTLIKNIRDEEPIKDEEILGESNNLLKEILNRRAPLWGFTGFWQ